MGHFGQMAFIYESVDDKNLSKAIFQKIMGADYYHVLNM